MKYVAIYRREDSGTPLTILKDARIRQVATSEELGLGLGLGKMLFVQVECVGYGYEYYSASAYRVLEVERCQDKN